MPNAKVIASPNLEVIEKWAAALESGEYAQTTGVLHRPTPDAEAGKPAGFCCLGVLCELAAKDGVISAGLEDPASGTILYSGNESFPPERVVEWAGLPSFNPTLEHDDPHYIEGVDPDDKQRTRTEASELNDSFGFTFAQIAQAIRDTFLTNKKDDK